MRSYTLFSGGSILQYARLQGSVGIFFVDRAKGAYFWDADGNKFIDYIGS